MRLAKWLAVGVMAATWSVHGEPARPLDLKEFAGKLPNEGAEYLVPHGAQVVDGIPFQMDGPVWFFATNSVQKGKHCITNANNIAVGSRFEKLHLIAATDFGGDDGPSIAKLDFVYADGSTNVLELHFGEQMRCWQAAWHKPEAPLKSADAHVVWVGQASFAAQSDKYLRFFHATFANPAPDKEVRVINIESARTQHGLVLLAMSVSSATPDKLADTITPPRDPFPDVRPRKGDPAVFEGVVKTSEGKPIPHALIRVSGLREFGTEDKTTLLEGPGVNCGAEADENGHFTLPALPDNKLYRLVVWAQGYDSTRYRGIDPKSDPIEVRLKKLKGNSTHPAYIARGRVVGPDGKPMPYALVEHEMFNTRNMQMWASGAQQGFPTDILSDKNGEFTYGRDEKFDGIQVKFNVPEFAQKLEWIEVTNTQVQTIKLMHGSTLRGRVLLTGQPLTNMVIGLSDTGGNGLSQMTTKTGTNGAFVFEHVPPTNGWNLYGQMNSFKKYGALPPRLERSSDDGQTTDIGDLTVIPAIHLVGTVKTKNGEPLPKGLKVYMNVDDSGDGQNVPVATDGSFRFEGLYARNVRIFVAAEKWHLSRDNRSRDMWDVNALTGQLQDNKDDLLIMIDKGAPQYNYDYTAMNGQLPQTDWSRNRPLYGAEDSGPGYVVLAGKVVDDSTGAPIQNFKVVPGYKPPVTPLASGMAQPQKSLLERMIEPFAKKNNNISWNERIWWDFNGSENSTNGFFRERYVPISCQPVLRIEAGGYEPVETDPTNQTTTNLVLRLRKAPGPNGIVLDPNGKPAKKAMIIYAVGNEQYSLSNISLDKPGRTNCWRQTAEDGKFSFDGREATGVLFVSHPSGWVQYPLKGGDKDLKLELQPWAGISGTLVNSNGVTMSNVDLGLTSWETYINGDRPIINLQHATTTDAKGHFLFTNVPPTRLTIQRMEPMHFGGGGYGWTWHEETWLYVKPGITNDLGNVIYDQPPPHPAMERIKESLGL